ncbi:unnamed protein product [Rotaria sp. Silwood1]|nr:unnamed protein product [Rotaria sp. Silwood1]CAF1613884.1 unnamed protein product [Rotaria sp. Silwood1]CAF3691532.1 unnamed protein product [Rotaria sp. Silwood1]CAF3740497.1 unnamed protein product [Rotaria sp. Silwood1]CAF3751777.1 unnamed protein product [Rotaria sp. Silwood1]
MKLYQHSTQCPMAIQWFLDENPDYWPFIPTKLTPMQVQTKEEIEDTALFTYANDVPPPPPNYIFTYEQKLAIDRFFHEKKYLNSPNDRLDLYHAAIIAVLPQNTSDRLRRFIEALFITHAETKLNSIGHMDEFIFSNDLQETSSMNNVEWCHNLIRRSNEASKN